MTLVIEAIRKSPDVASAEEGFYPYFPVIPP